MRIAAIAFVAAAALVLTGCTPGAHPSATSSPKATPVFRSDAEALAAAEKAYGAYLQTTDLVAGGGGSDPSPLKPIVTADLYKKELASSGRLRASGLHQTGTTAHSPLKLQQVNPLRTELTAYSCVDLSAVHFVDAQGADKTPSRNGPIPIAVGFESSHGTLLIASNEPWSGQDFC